ncbi:hypothetical protein LTR64_008444 [Lithohypha guttulata]|uniref:uncharacterized protein n=1 Tax=Lithohypha guttulata TaxID=1690604 RepID=UPI002DDF841E|nr:hypothetical protein LTR51_008512 [Lithohypha guttulata]
MESPKKRRKNNDSKPVAVSSRSLHSFFGKQNSTPDAKQNGNSKFVDKLRSPGDNVISDEELARQLQEQWQEEDRRAEARTNEAIQEVSAQQVTAHQSTTTSAENAHNTGTDEATFAVSAPEPAPQPLQEHGKNAAGNKSVLSLQSTGAAEDTVTQNIPFDQSPFTFRPSDYLPDLKRHWAADGGDASYALLTRCFILINATTSRIKTVDTLVNCLRLLIEGDPESLLPAVWLATNSISPPYISLELGLGGSAISKALKKVCALDNAGLKSLYDKYGDAGDVAFEAKKRQSFTLRKPKPLSIKIVYQLLVKIATSKGQGSVEQKQRFVERLVQDARGAEESRYIVRTLVQHLRIGAVKTTMLIALARAFTLARPSGAHFPIRDTAELGKLKKEDLAPIWAKVEETVKTCFARRPNYNDLVAALLEIGVCEELLIRCNLTMHVPLRPMLGSITRDLSEMLTKLQGRDFSCEYKYDGQRAQVHCDENGKVSIFSRHLEAMTDKYPDLVALVPEVRGEGVSSFILEGEVVAVDQQTGDLKTFQTLTNRARKDVEIGTIQVNVCLFAFDLMYLNGEPLLNRPFRERRGLLRNMFIEKQYRFTWVKSIDATSQDSETVQEFLKSAIDIKCEGIMVKVLDNLPNPDLITEDMENYDALKQELKPPPTPSRGTPSKKGRKKTQDEKEEEKKSGARRKALLSTYEPDKRLDSWLKVKKDYDSTVFDTIDLIPVAAWHGQGRKANWWSPILLACRNPETGSLEVVTKCISGFSDKFYKENKEKYSEDGENTTKTKPSYIEYSGGHPAVWFEPQEVWEMAFADITLSPVYTAAIGLVSEDRGLSMRFPRFLKVREDKSIDEASTNDFLAGLYRKQEEKLKIEGKPSANDVDGEEDV